MSDESNEYPKGQVGHKATPWGPDPRPFARARATGATRGESASEQLRPNSAIEIRSAPGSSRRRRFWQAEPERPETELRGRPASASSGTPTARSPAHDTPRQDLMTARDEPVEAIRPTTIPAPNPAPKTVPRDTSDRPVRDQTAEAVARVQGDAEQARAQLDRMRARGWSVERGASAQRADSGIPRRFRRADDADRTHHPERAPIPNGATSPLPVRDEARGPGHGQTPAPSQVVQNLPLEEVAHTREPRAPADAPQHRPQAPEDAAQPPLHAPTGASQDGVASEAPPAPPHSEGVPSADAVPTEPPSADAPAPAAPAPAAPAPSAQASEIPASETLASETPASEAPAETAAEAPKTRMLGMPIQAALARDGLLGTPENAALAEPVSSPVAFFPTGWLVVVSGPGTGASYPLPLGVATIGRGKDQTVRLDFGDRAISRNAHASVAFDPETARFYLGANPRSNLVRRNDRPVLGTDDLEDGDLIRLGDTALRFIAFCGDGQIWTERERDPQS